MATRPSPLPREHYARFRSLQTRWADADVYGHVNNAVYYQLFDTAVNGPLVEAGWLDPSRSDSFFLVVDSGCSYFRELCFPDVIEAGVVVSHLGRSAVTYGVGLFRVGDGHAAAQGHFVHVNVDRSTRKPMAIAAGMRGYLQSLAKWADKAGENR